MIELNRASRWYGQVIGLNDVSCQVGVGVTALLGQNGAGKSTMLKLITGQLRPTTGECRVFGMDPFANPDVFRRLGFCPDIDSFPEHLNGFQFVYRMARFSGYGDSEARKRTGDIIEQVGMADRCQKPVKGYSKGMRQRIKLASAMVHNPDLLLLDEPLNGLDPVGRREFMDLLHQFAAQGKGILVSSHILFEVEQMTRSLLLLHRGRLLASGDLRTIRDLIDSHPHRIRIVVDRPRELAAELVKLPFVLSAQFGQRADELEVRTREPGRFYEALPPIVLDQKLKVYEFDSPDNNLESVFRYLVEGR